MSSFFNFHQPQRVESGRLYSTQAFAQAPGGFKGILRKVYNPAPVPLKKDITKPNNPTTVRAMMANIGGKPVPFPTSAGSKVD